METVPPMPQPRHVTLTGQRVRAWVGGKGPFLLLLHTGWGDAGMSWRNVWDRLALSFTVIAPDLPGFGESSRLLRPSLSAISGLLKQLLDFLNVDRVIVVGNSFGASVAVQFAGEFPAVTSNLVLVNGGYTPAIPGMVRTIFSLPLLNQIFGMLIRRISFSPGALKRAFVDPSCLPPGFLDTILNQSAKHAQLAQEFLLNQAGPLAKPSVPTLILWGQQDRLSPMKYAHALQAWLPEAGVIPIKGCGHMPQIERPEDFLSAILSLKPQRSQ